jgi:hypothetical protein
MNAWTRWRIAFPLTGLTLLLLVPAIVGAVAWWSLRDPAERVLTVVICLILTAGLAVSLSIGITRTERTPWLRIGLVLSSFLLTCGLAAWMREI